MKPAPPVTMTFMARSIRRTLVLQNMTPAGRDSRGNWAVLVGQHRGGRRDRPGDAEIGIVPQHAAIVRRRVGARHLVEHLGVGLERAEAVREADRHEELRPVLGRNLGGDVAAEGRRAAPQIDRDVEDAPARHPDQLGLGVRRGLEMQAADRARLRRARMIVLDEFEVDAGGGQRRRL